DARPRDRGRASGGMTTDAALRRTPLYEEHRGLGARMVPFAGYEMPIQYAGIVAEHRAVREAAGLFDLSHMGEFHFEGPTALAAGDRLAAGHIIAALPPFGVKSARAAGAEATIARTGYTGEDGFEVFVDNADAVQVWQALLVAGHGDALVPVGLGARDTLRLEARFSLYGN